jgi:hypothetical protein
MVSRVGDYFKAKQDMEMAKLKFENEIALRHVDERIMELEWQGRNQVAVTEGESSMDVSNSQAFQSTLLKEPSSYSVQAITTASQNWLLIILDFYRGVIRPLVTTYLCILVTILYFTATSEEKLEIIKTILFLANTCILWWFGSRSKNSNKTK